MGGHGYLNITIFRNGCNLSPKKRKSILQETVEERISRETNFFRYGLIQKSNTRDFPIVVFG